MGKEVRVLVSLGRCLLRDAFLERMEKEALIDVCGVAEGYVETQERMALLQPDVLAVNITLNSRIGLYSLKLLKQEFPKTKVLAFSCSSEFEDTYVNLCLCAGADGYISSKDSMEDLISALAAVYRGEQVGRPCVSKDMENIFGELSVREAEVFCLMGCGVGTRNISERMGVSMKTVETYQERTKSKTSLSSKEVASAASSLIRCAARDCQDEVEDCESVKELLSAIS